MDSTIFHSQQTSFDQQPPNFEKTLHGYLLDRCKQHGDNVAVVTNTCDGKSITFRDVYEQSRNCAVFLHEHGIKKGDFVAVCLPNCTEYAVAILGIMACGATVALCNPNFNKGEIMQQFAITQPKATFVHETALGTMKKVKENLPCLQEIFVVGNGGESNCSFNTIVNGQYDTDVLDSLEVTSDDLAMIPYSSGTTGLPKGVMLTHKNLLSEAMAYCKCFVRYERNCVYTDRPLYHTYGALTLICCLSCGKKLVTGKEFEIGRLIKSIKEHQVTHLTAVPPILIRLDNAGDDADYEGQISSLKQVLCSGAPLAPNVFHILSERYNVEFVNLYGMTEAGVPSFNQNVKEHPESVGFPAQETEIKITDPETLVECPAEQNGEILVRGPQVTKGYLKNPEANANAFNEEGWFRTGDIGHFDKEGRLFVVDRLKDVIKYKSIQVSPAELESVILKHPKIADVGVTGIPDGVAGELPKAFVVKKDVSLTEQDVDDFVKSHLVDYKQLRGGVEFVKAIPKSVTGKVQRKELKKMAGIEI